MSTGTKFIVLTSQRSGSSWLMDILNRLDGTKTYGELFFPRKRERPEVFSNDHPRFVEFDSSSVFAYMNSLYRQDASVGFKLMYSQLRVHPALFLYLLVKRIRVVHLVRRNHLDVVISSYRSKATGTAHLKLGEKQDGPPVRITLDPEELVPRLRKLRRHQRMMQAAVNGSWFPHMDMAYEDLLADGPKNFDRVFEFLSLDVPDEFPTSVLVKRGKGSHADVLENYDEIRQTLADSEFESLLRG